MVNISLLSLEGIKLGISETSIDLLFVLQTQVLKVGQVNESCIGLTQENSIENSVQDCLSYILKPYGLH